MPAQIGSKGNTRPASKSRVGKGLGTGNTGKSALSHNTQAYEGCPKATQVNTEGTQLFLYQRGVPGIDDGLCACRRGLQSVKHVLLSCPHYAGLRKSVLWKEEKKTTDLRTLLSTPALAIKAAKFMAQTKLLGHIGVPS